MNQEQEQLFNDYLNGRGRDLSTEKKIVKLFCGGVNENSLKRRMRKDWDALSETKVTKDLNPILYKLHYIINLENERKFSQKGGLKKILFWYSKVAAVLLLPIIGLLIGWLLINDNSRSQPSLVEVIAPMGARIKTQLPDGTITWLNSGSALRYTIPFNQRNVTLQGEGFFHVKKDSLHPFVVKGKQGSVRVLGTRFNIDMWPDEEVMEVVLEEGKVEFIPNGSQQTFLMTPGQMIVYNSLEKKLSRRNVNPEHYSAWKDGILMLRGENMHQMARELSRWFNVDVVIDDSLLLDYSFRATFKDEKLEDVLRLLKLSSPIQYEIIDNKIDKSGNFSRKKVILRHK